MFDFFFQGGIDPRFTDWDSAREFVLEQTINANPRLDDDTKSALRAVEQDAYNEHANKWLDTEKTEIAKYYVYLRNQFPSVTNDAQFLAIYDVAVEVKADESSVSFSDVTVPKPIKFGLPVVALAALTLLILTRD